MEALIRNAVDFMAKGDFASAKRLLEKVLEIGNIEVIQRNKMVKEAQNEYDVTFANAIDLSEDLRVELLSTLHAQIDNATRNLEDFTLEFSKHHDFITSLLLQMQMQHEEHDELFTGFATEHLHSSGRNPARQRRRERRQIQRDAKSFVDRFCAWVFENFVEVEPRLPERPPVALHALDPHIYNVPGDGACGAHAILASLAGLHHNIILPYQHGNIDDPLRPQMHAWIYELKNAMFACIQQIIRDPENQWFERALCTIPENGATRDLSHYKEKLMAPDYMLTNLEMRVAALTLGIQINVIRSTPTEHERYQSFPVGEVEPVKNTHINILHVSGHYKSIVGLKEGVLMHQDVLDFLKN